MLAACGTKQLASVTGICETRPRADVQMFGADPLSQNFLDETIEANVAQCDHARPAPRPDPRAAQPKPKAKPKVAAKPKPKTWLQKLTPKKQAAPEPAAAPAPVQHDPWPPIPPPGS